MSWPRDALLCPECRSPSHRYYERGVTCGQRHWLISLDGFDEMVQPGATRDKARWANYRAGREAGYFSGGFSDYLARLHFIRETEVEFRL